MSTMWHFKPKVLVVFVLCVILVLFAYHNETTEPWTIPTSDNLGLGKNLTEFQRFLSQATSGQEFSGVPFQTFPLDKYRFRGHKYSSSSIKTRRKVALMCTKWGVVTTIFAPQESVRRFLYKQDWCIVVVGDKDRPKVSPWKLTIGKCISFNLHIFSGLFFPIHAWQERHIFVRQRPRKDSDGLCRKNAMGQFWSQKHRLLVRYC